MTVYFIGAGPGAADLLTLRGRDLLERCPVCLRRLHRATGYAEILSGRCASGGYGPALSG